MAQSLADVILHIVFSTKERSPWIHPNIEEELYKYICGVCRNLKSPIVAINGTEDHLHILLQLEKTVPLSKLISEIKSNSSRWIKIKYPSDHVFAWQNGYAGFSVSRSNLEMAKKYLSSQKEHHKRISFKEELLAMLKKSQLTYDEKYLWN